MNFDKDKKGFKIKKEVLRNLDVGYEVQQKRTSERADQIEQKVSGNIKVTEQVSVDVAKEIKDGQEQSAEGVLPQEVPEETIFLKYRRKF